jgi:hypothetical protein
MFRPSPGLLACGFLLLVWITPASHAASHLGIFGGIHGGPITHFSNGSISDPVKEGTIGLSHGLQGGLDFGSGPFWMQLIYMVSNTRVTDYRATGSVKPVLSNVNRVLTAPLMYAMNRNDFTFGVGAYYSHPLSNDSQRDHGMVLAARRKLGRKFFLGLDWLGGFREQAQGGNNLQFLLNLGYSLK